MTSDKQKIAQCNHLVLHLGRHKGQTFEWVVSDRRTDGRTDENAAALQKLIRPIG